MAAAAVIVDEVFTRQCLLHLATGASRPTTAVAQQSRAAMSCEASYGGPKKQQHARAPHPTREAEVHRGQREAATREHGEPADKAT